MNGMAKMGKGAAAYIGKDESPEVAMGQFFERISHPAMTDVAVETAGTSIKEIYPKRIPDVFAGRPVIITGRFEGELHGPLHIRARIDGKEQDIAVPIEVSDSAAAKRSNGGCVRVIRGSR